MTMDSGTTSRSVVLGSIFRRGSVASGGTESRDYRRTETCVGGFQLVDGGSRVERTRRSGTSSVDRGRGGDSFETVVSPEYCDSRESDVEGGSWRELDSGRRETPDYHARPIKVHRSVFRCGSAGSGVTAGCNASRGYSSDGMGSLHPRHLARGCSRERLAGSFTSRKRPDVRTRLGACTLPRKERTGSQGCYSHGSSATANVGMGPAYDPAFVPEARGSDLPRYDGAIRLLDPEVRLPSIGQEFQEGFNFDDVGFRCSGTRNSSIDRARVGNDIVTILSAGAYNSDRGHADGVRCPVLSGDRSNPPRVRDVESKYSGRALPVVHGVRLSRRGRLRRGRRSFVLAQLANRPVPLLYNYFDPIGTSRTCGRKYHTNYTGLKEVTSSTLNMRWVCSIVDERCRACLRGLRSVGTFRDTFMGGQLGHPHPPRHTAWPELLWGKLTNNDPAIIERVPDEFKVRPGYCHTLRLVDDRKNPSLGRIISPCCELNDACVEPPPAPIPLLIPLVLSLCNADWLISADFKSWFFALLLNLSVASAFFRVMRGGVLYAQRRGLLGWKFMPFIMTSIAIAIASRAVGSTSAWGVWVDNFVAGVSSFGEGNLVLSRLRAEAVKAGAVVHEDGIPVKQLVVLGVEISTTLRAWRLSPAWASTFVDAWETRRNSKYAPLRDTWHMVGCAGWAVYALSLPQMYMGRSAQYVSAQGALLQSKMISLDVRVPLPQDVRDALDGVASVVKQNPWRGTVSTITRPPMVIFTDAAVEDSLGSRGAVLPTRGGWLVVGSGVFPTSKHINVLEVETIPWALARLPVLPVPGTVVRIVVDSSVAEYQMRRGRGKPWEANVAVAAAMRWAARYQVGLEIDRVPSEFEPADLPSRWQDKRTGLWPLSSKVVESALALLKPLRPRIPIAFRPPPL